MGENGARDVIAEVVNSQCVSLPACMPKAKRVVPREMGPVRGAETRYV